MQSTDRTLGRCRALIVGSRDGGVELRNKLIIFFLAISLVVIPSTMAAALKIEADTPVSMLCEPEKCHQTEESKCCTYECNECECSLTGFFPVSVAPFCATYSQQMNSFQPAGLRDPDADRLVRPPRYS